MVNEPEPHLNGFIGHRSHNGAKQIKLIVFIHNKKPVAAVEGQDPE